MGQVDLSRRGLLALIGGGASWFAWLSLCGSTAFAGRRDLKGECAAFVEAKRALRLPEARSGNWTLGEKPGPKYAEAMSEMSRAGEDLFGSPALCRADVLRKYAVLEEYGYRSFHAYYLRWHGKPAFAHWYAQLDEDIARFGVDVNAWWRPDRSSSLPEIDGRPVMWRDGAWHDATEFLDRARRVIAESRRRA